MLLQPMGMWVEFIWLTIGSGTISFSKGMNFMG